MSHRLSAVADLDLDGIYAYGVIEFGLRAANNYLAKLVETFDLLAENPRIARLRQEVRPPVRAYPCQSHIIIYEIDDANDILILRVHHGREDWLDL